MRINLNPTHARVGVAPSRFPKLEDIPIVSDIYAIYKEKQKEKAHQEMQKIGRCVRGHAPVAACVGAHALMHDAGQNVGQRNALLVLPDP